VGEKCTSPAQQARQQAVKQVPSMCVVRLMLLDMLIIAPPSLLKSSPGLTSTSHAIYAPAVSHAGSRSRLNSFLSTYHAGFWRGGGGPRAGGIEPTPHACARSALASQLPVSPHPVLGWGAAPLQDALLLVGAPTRDAPRHLILYLPVGSSWLAPSGADA
jgi:hypothetical protein